MALSAQESATYFATEGQKANPLSPTQYEAQLRGGTTTNQQGVPRAITSDVLRSTGTFVPPIAPTTDFSSAMNSAIASASYSPPSVEDIGSSFNTFLKQLEGASTAPSSSTELYKQLYSQSGIEKDTNLINDFNAQLEAIKAGQEIIPEQIEKESEGRIRTGQVIGGMSRQRLRDYYLENYPKTVAITAQLNAAQGRVNAAKENISTLLQLTQQDVQNQLAYKERLYDRALQFANAKQADEIRKLQEFNNTQKQAQGELNDLRNTFTSAAINAKNYALAARIAGARTLQEVQSLGAQIQPQGTETGTTSTATPTVSGGALTINSLEDIRNAPVGDLTKAVMGGTIKLKDLTPTDKAVVASELFKIGFNPQQYVLSKIQQLATLYENVPSWARGLIQGRIPFVGSFDPDAAKFDSAKTILTREIARLNDVGVLSDQDVASYNDAMPSRGDASINVVNSKLEGVGISVGQAGEGATATADDPMGIFQ